VCVYIGGRWEVLVLHSSVYPPLRSSPALTQPVRITWMESGDAPTLIEKSCITPPPPFPSHAPRKQTGARAASTPSSTRAWSPGSTSTASPTRTGAFLLCLVWFGFGLCCLLLLLLLFFKYHVTSSHMSPVYFVSVSVSVSVSCRDPLCFGVFYVGISGSGSTTKPHPTQPQPTNQPTNPTPPHTPQEEQKTTNLTSPSPPPQEREAHAAVPGGR
jgi:hypothetical protein